MKTFARIFPWILVGVVALYFSIKLLAPAAPEGPMDIRGFSAILAQEGGRYKPLDTIGRIRLMMIAYRQSARLKDPKTDTESTISADRWLLDIMAFGLLKRYQRVPIGDPEVLKFLALEPRPSQLYDIDELADKLPAISEWAEKVLRGKDKKPTRFDIQIVQLDNHVTVYMNMARGLSKQKINPATIPIFRIENQDVIAMLGLEPRPGLRYSYREILEHQDSFDQFQAKVDSMRQAQERGEESEDLVSAKTMELAHQLDTFLVLVHLRGSAGMIPVAGGKWLSLGDALDKMEQSGANFPEASSLSGILYAYAVGDAETFNKEVANYRQNLSKQYPTETKKSGTELFFNDFDPFYLCTIFYIAVFVLCCLSWFGWTKPLLQSALLVGILVWFVHTWALGARMYIMGRPPVTNLYSSAVFIGWGCVLLCLVLECIFRNGFGTLVASLLGFLTLLVAMHLDSGETMEVLVAVLDTNFWLATHVVCVTLGYTATFVAGTLGCVYIFFGLLVSPPAGPGPDARAKVIDRPGVGVYALFLLLFGFFGAALLSTKNAIKTKTLGNMIYGVVCFATLLSFVGTVLGGIWADQSWGRFWGWDPKENGALLIVIWNALILHARWGGLVKDRGMAVLAVVGNMITGWSWFGTNQLGVGLHNYGFNKTLAMGLVIGWTVHLGIIIAGCLPLRYWRSFKSVPTVSPEASSGPAPTTVLPPSRKGNRRLRPA